MPKQWVSICYMLEEEYLFFLGKRGIRVTNLVVLRSCALGVFLLTWFWHWLLSLRV